jgi:hypothetical protein
MCQIENIILVDDANVMVFVRILMGDVVRNIVNRNDVVSVFMRNFYGWQQIVNATKKHDSLLSHYPVTYSLGMFDFAKFVKIFLLYKK